MIIGEAAPYRHVEHIEICATCEHRKATKEKIVRKTKASAKVLLFFLPCLAWVWHTALWFYPNYQGGWGEFIFGGLVLPATMLFFHVFAFAYFIMALEE